jgi:hypothetical protein
MNFRVSTAIIVSSATMDMKNPLASGAANICCNYSQEFEIERHVHPWNQAACAIVSDKEARMAGS